VWRYVAYLTTLQTKKKSLTAVNLCCIVPYMVQAAAHESDKREGRTVHARFKQLYLSNQSELDTCLHKFFFSQCPILSPPKILTFPHESPCISRITEDPATDLKTAMSWDVMLW
jgi:hypothetical protein